MTGPGKVPQRPNPQPDEPVEAAAPGWRSGDPWLGAAALAGVLTFPVGAAAGMLSVLAANADLNPGSSDAQMLAAYLEYRDQTLVSSSLSALTAVLTWVCWARYGRGFGPGRNGSPSSP